MTQSCYHSDCKQINSCPMMLRSCRLLTSSRTTKNVIIRSMTTICPNTRTFSTPVTWNNSPLSLFDVHPIHNSTSSTLIVKRFKNSSKVGHHLDTLDEMAHRPEREAAQERRKKKKERKQNKKNSPQKATETEALDVQDDDDDDFLLDFDEDTEEDTEEAEPSLPDPSLVKEKMMRVVERFEESLKTIRGAEPTAEMFDDLMVNAYGSMTPLKAVGQVVIVSPTLAQITCFDPMIAKSVSKAIQLALELNPQVEEGGGVKVPLPRVSMDVRQQLAKQLKKKAESCRQRIRQVRRKAMDMVKKGKDGKIPGVSKDDAFANGKEIESVTESVMQTLQQMVDTKMDAIMAV